MSAQQTSHHLLQAPVSFHTLFDCQDLFIFYYLFILLLFLFYYLLFICKVTDCCVVVVVVYRREADGGTVQEQVRRSLGRAEPQNRRPARRDREADPVTGEAEAAGPDDLHGRQRMLSRQGDCRLDPG